MRKPTSSTMLTTKSSTTTTTTTPCCTKVGLKRGPWTPEEDKALSDFISKEGEGRWRTLPKRAGLLRCGKSCRLRWMNYLRPSVKRGQIAPDEEDLILRLHRLLGNRWSLIAGRIPGRTDNEIKNYWNTHLSKKLISQGIDPRTHKPLSNTTTTTDDHQLMVTSVSPSATEAPKNDHNDAASNLPLVDGGRGSATTTRPDNISAFGLVEHHLSDGSPPRLVIHSYVNDDDDQLQAMIDNVTLVGRHVNNSFLNLSPNNGDNQDQRDDDMNYSCGGEDVFSSFINSLINEDDQVFIHTGQMMQHPHTNQLMQANHQPILSNISDPLAHDGDHGFDGSFGFVNGSACANNDGNWGITAATLMPASGNAVFMEKNQTVREYELQHVSHHLYKPHSDRQQCSSQPGTFVSTQCTNS